MKPDTPAQGADTPPATEVLLVSSRQDEKKPASVVLKGE